MKQTIFDKIFLGFLVIIISVFLLLITYTTYATKRTLRNEKQASLLNQAEFISQQTLNNYISGNISKESLISQLNKQEDYLKVKVWFTDEKGDIIAVSHKEAYSNLPDNIFSLDDSDTLKSSFTLTGDFYHTFSDDVISVGLPIYSDQQLQGYIILHTSISDLDSVQTEIFAITYIPFFAIILISFVFLAYLSNKILRPLARINETAKEYSKGNFEAKTNITSNDELGELADSLNCMASDLSKLDEYRKNFIANISHDFRSPLTSIKGYLEAMLDGTIPVDNYDKYLTIVLNESKRLTKLTSGLLELNNFDTYGPILKKTTFDVMSIITDTTNTFEGRVVETGINFKINCLAKNTKVVADKIKMQQVIYNLVDNAIKFSPSGSTITIEISERNEKLFVAVKDKGTGIEKSKQKQVWDRFYKTDPSRGKDKKGTGLGLSITKEIIKAHDEHINLISTEGVGSEFIFSLTKSKE